MLSYRIARFMDDYDHYGFMDALETGESINAGIERAAREAYSVMLEGDFGQIREWIYDPDLDEPANLKAEMDSIMAELKRLEDLHAQTISKNPLRIKRRTNRCS